jgi:vancomycin permeability regulator SanA
MTPKRRKILIVCLIVLAVSMAVMAVSTVIQVIHNGWEAFSVINTVPFFGMAIVLIIFLQNDKKKDDK